MPINYSRTKFSGRLNLNADVRPSLRWISPETVFGATGFGAVNVPLVVEVRNLPAATFTITEGELPQGLALVGSAIVGNTLGIASSTYNITIRAKSRHLFEDREFQLVIVGGDYDFRWVTPEGLIDGSNETEPTAAVVEAHDPFNLPITYRRVGGPLPIGTTFNANGVFTGDYGFVENDTDYTFIIEADNGVQQIEREFTISVWDTPPGDAPQWETPKGDLGRFYEGMDISLFLNAFSPNGQEIEYEIKGGSPPLGTQLMANGVVQGLLDEVSDDTTFRITVGASNDGGENFSRRLFEITVLENYPPVWETPEGVLVSEVEGYDVDLTLVATDRNSPDQTVSYELTGNLPTGLIFDPVAGKITGEMPPHEGEIPQEFSFTVSATDSLKRTPRAFKIVNTKDFPPVFSAGGANTVVEYFGLEQEYLETDPNPAFDPNGKPITYTITGGAIPPGFSLNPATGSVFGTLPAAPTEDLVYDFVLTVADKKFNANINVRITSWMNTQPVWETTEIGFGIENKFFERQLVAVDRELKDVTFTIISGTFPTNDLTLDSDGRIAGFLPLLPDDNDATYNFNVEASDGIMTSVQNFTLVVQKNRPPVWVTPAGDLGNPTLGQKSFFYTFEAVDPNEQPVSYQLLSIERSNYQGTGPENDITDFSFSPTGTVSGRMGTTFIEDITYTIRVAALDGDHPPVSNPSVIREFTFERKINLPPVWVTEPLLLDTWERAEVDVPLEAFDPEGEQIFYTRENAGGPIYRNDFLQGFLNLVDGRVVGRLPFGLEDREISFFVDADDNTNANDDLYKTRRIFTIIARFNEPPSFITPQGLFIKRVENEVIDYNVVAVGEGNAPRIIYSITSGTLPQGVTMDDTGRFTGRFPMVAGEVDESYVVTVMADNGTKTVEGTFELVVEKNIAPVWETQIGEIHFSLANIPMSTSISATDANEDRGRPITYSAVGLPVGLTINPTTGVISGKLPLDFFEVEYPFVGFATDGLETIQRNFMIRGLHNEPMVWDTEAGLFAWPLDDLNPYSTRVQATDPEQEELVYTLVSGSLPEGLTFHANGVIDGFTKSVTADEEYPLTINVADSYYNEDRSFFLLIVDNLPPEWITPAGNIGSLIGGEDLIIQLEAVDAYAETVLAYSVQGSLPPGIGLNSETGVIRGTLPANFEPDNIYSFDVIVTDGVFSVPRTFEIEALQNRPPLFVTDGGLLGDVHVNAVASWTIVATDDHDRPIIYSIASDQLPPGLTLNGTTGVISGKAGFDEPAVYGFSVRADDGIKESTRGFSISLLNDKPVWNTPADMGDANEQSMVNVTVLATDPEGAPITYEAQSVIPGLSLNGSTGAITGTLPEVTEDTIMTFRIVAKDGHVFSDPRDFFFNVKFVSPPVWQTPSGLPAGTEQYPYTASLSALSNNQAVTYQVVTGTFPSSLTLAPDGTISGNMPVVEGNTTFTFEVEATAGTKRASREFTLLVRENQSPLWQTGETVPTVAQNTENYAVNFLASDPNGTPLVYSFVGGSIPPGLTFDFGTSGEFALLSGDIGASNDDVTYTFMLGADDGFIRTDRTFSLLVTGNRPPVWTVNSGQIDEPVEGSNVTYTFLAQDPEEGEVTYSLVSDTIPLIPNTTTKYLEFDFVARTVTGLLPQVFEDTMWSFTLRASDPEGKTADVTYSILIKNDASRFDPLAPYVTSLIHFDGINNQTTGVKDFADPNRVLTFNSGTTLQTATRQFGTAALRRDGTAGGGVSYPTSDDTNLDTSVTPEWTVELWIRPAATQLVSEAALFSIGYAAAPNSGYNRVHFSLIGGNVEWRVATGAGAYSMSLGAVTQNTWTHIAVSRASDGVMRVFKNGILMQSRANSLVGALIGSNTPSVSIGGSLGFGATDFNGSIDELRITKRCRYTATFPLANTPFPSPPYFTTAANTILATGDEGTFYAGGATPVVATVTEADVAALPVLYSTVTGGFTMDAEDGVLSFTTFPVAYDATTNTQVIVQAQDANGNKSRFWPVNIRSNAASPSDLKVQWRMSNTPTATKSTNPGNPVTVSALDTSTANMQPAPAPYGAEQAFRMSSRVNYSIQDNLGFLSGDSTVEMWVYPTSLTGDNLHLVSIGGTAMRLFRHTAVDAFTTVAISNRLVLQYGGSTTQVVEGGGDLVQGQWNHVAYTRSGNTMRLYVNGVGGPTVNFNPISFGAQTFAFNGFSSQNRGIHTDLYMRAVNMWSSVRYVGNFTPSWPNFGAEIANAPDLYWSFDKATGSSFLPDRGTVTNLVVAGSTVYSPELASPPTQPFNRQIINFQDGNSSLKFNHDFFFLEADWSLEMWVRWPSVSRQFQTVFDIGGELTTNYFRILNNTTSGFGPLTFLYNGSAIAFPSGLVQNQWVHLAVTKQGNQIRAYTNGIGGTAQGVSSTNMGVTMQNKVATINGYTLTTTWTGVSKMANVGFWKTAKYTANFIPPPR